MKQISLRGNPFYIHDGGDSLSGAIESSKDFWESDILDYIRVNYPIQKTIVDVGANMGNHSFYFAQYLQYKSMYCFEPIWENYEILMANMVPFDNVVLLNAAASSKSGKLRMTMNGSNTGAHYVNEEGPVEIWASSLDRLLCMEDVTLIKIDAEGHEPAILDGASDTFARCHPLLVIEDADRFLDFIPEGYHEIGRWEHHRTFMYEWREW